MGSVALEGFGGGGAALNFKVVGSTTEPVNPKENMIWVNTDQKITSWFLFVTEPENPDEGMIWITIGTSGSAKFNALKKNGIQVYPLLAKQYISGAWVSRTAKSYHGGQWVDWMQYLYNAGNKYTDVTGGWTFGLAQTGDSYTIAGYTDGASSITIKLSTANTAITARTKYKIDLSGFSKLKLQVSSNTISRSVYLAVSSDGRFANTTTTSQVAISGKQTGIFTLDVSSLETSLYVGVYSWLSYGADTSTGGSLTFNKAWLE